LKKRLALFRRDEFHVILSKVLVVSKFHDAYHEGHGARRKEFFRDLYYLHLARKLGLLGQAELHNRHVSGSFNHVRNHTLNAVTSDHGTFLSLFQYSCLLQYDGGSLPAGW